MNIKQTALILIDIQKESSFGVQGVEQVTAKANQLASACRDKGIPVIFTRHINRADGIGLSKGELLINDSKPRYYSSDTEKIEIVDGITVAKEDIVIDKYRWSAFFGTSLDLLLKSMGIKHLIVGGLVTDGCVMTSVYDAYFLDYDIHLIHDICATTNEGAQMSSLLLMANWIYNLKVYDTGNVMNRLSGKSYDMWEATKPDALQFTPENMREMFNILKKG